MRLLCFEERKVANDRYLHLYFSQEIRAKGLFGRREARAGQSCTAYGEEAQMGRQT
jgi:hypothetical protein